MNIQALLYHPGSRTSCGRSVGRKENNLTILLLLTSSMATHGICYLPLELENKIQHTFLSFLQPFFHALFTPIYTTSTVPEPIDGVVAARARPENHTLILWTFSLIQNKTIFLYLASAHYVNHVPIGTTKK